MYYFIKNSSARTVHTRNCRFIKGKEVDVFDTPNEAIRASYRLCMCCNTLDSIYYAELKNIEPFLKDNDFDVFVEEGYVFVGARNGWKITLEDGELHLYRQHIKNDKASSRFSYEYVPFNLTAGSIRSILECIADCEEYEKEEVPFTPDDENSPFDECAPDDAPIPSFSTEKRAELYELEDVNDMIGLCKELERIGYSEDSHAYFNDGSFYLAISSENEAALAIADEFGERNAFAVSYADEHFTKVRKTDAVPTLARM